MHHHETGKLANFLKLELIHCLVVLDVLSIAVQADDSGLKFFHFL